MSFVVYLFLFTVVCGWLDGRIAPPQSKGVHGSSQGKVVK